MKVYRIIKSRRHHFQQGYLMKLGNKLYTCEKPNCTSEDVYEGHYTDDPYQFNLDERFGFLVKKPSVFTTFTGYIDSNLPELIRSDIWEYDINTAFQILISYFPQVPLSKFIDNGGWCDLAKMSTGDWFIVGAEGPFTENVMFYIVRV